MARAFAMIAIVVTIKMRPLFCTVYKQLFKGKWLNLDTCMHIEENTTQQFKSIDAHTRSYAHRTYQLTDGTSSTSKKLIMNDRNAFFFELGSSEVNTICKWKLFASGETVAGGQQK